MANMKETAQLKLNEVEAAMFRLANEAHQLRTLIAGYDAAVDEAKQVETKEVV